MRHIFFTLTFALLSITVYSQHDLQSSLYPENKFLINPANAGDRDFSPHLFMSYRHSLSGIPGALRRPLVGFHSPVSNEMGLGAILSLEQAGIFEYYTFAGSYSYSISLSKKNMMRFGFSSGIYSRKVNLQKVKVDNPDDDLLQTEYYSNLYYFAGIGMDLELNNLNIMVSLPKLYAGEDNSFVAAAVAGIGYNFHINDALFTPSVYTHYIKQNPIRFDLNLMYKMPEKYFIMISAKSDKSGAAGAGINLGSLNLCYIYELNTGLTSASKGSHEIQLSYTFSELKFKKRRL